MCVLNEILNIFFPQYCPVCGKKIVEEGAICLECIAKIPPLPFQQINFTTKRCFDGFFYRASYTGVVGKVIRAYKYIPRPSLSYFLSDLFLELFEQIPPPNNAVIAHVPITFDSLKEKGFDHIKRISLELSRKTGMKSLNLLEVSRQTKGQVGLSRADRRKQIAGKYEVIRKNLYKTSGIIVLIDDVFTTGATVNECSRMLKAAGASKVLVYTLARSTKK